MAINANRTFVRVRQRHLRALVLLLRSQIQVKGDILRRVRGRLGRHQFQSFADRWITYLDMSDLPTEDRLQRSERLKRAWLARAPSFEAALDAP
jgi:hypothetical protein